MTTSKIKKGKAGVSAPAFSFMALSDVHLERIKQSKKTKTVQCSAYKRGLVYVPIEKIHLVTCEACLKDHYAKIIAENR